MAVVGTAGHVDHGKSTLLRVLTGRDPDRWEEEKRRGLTIDLGFTWMTLPSGAEVSFVDVPGHQRYTRNMLAGIEAIDLALLLVAADEGWMPQTEEHLAILDLFGVNRGIVVVSKTDLVDDDLIELAALEAEEKLIGSSLEGSRVLPVSAETSAGIRELVTAIDTTPIGTRTEATAVRFWVDRAFGVAGAGTVVTGTLLGDALRVGESITAWPSGITARIRAIESHEKRLEVVEPHRRVALNLAGVGLNAVSRGTMLGRNGDWEPTFSLVARVNPTLRGDRTPERGSFHLHIGSSWTPMTMQELGDDHFLLSLQRLLPLRVGDRFAIRDSGRQTVVAGGVVIDPTPGPRPRRALHLLREIDPSRRPSEVAQALLNVRGHEDINRLRAHTGDHPEEATVIENTAFSDAEISRLSAEIVTMVERYHSLWPLRPGVPVSQVASRLGISKQAVEVIVSDLDDVRIDGPHLIRSDYSPAPTAEQEASWEDSHRLLIAGGLAVPRARELGIDQEHLHFLIRSGSLISVSDEFVYLPEQIALLRDALRGMDSEFALSDLRAVTSLSRLHLIPILEWSDREGITIRVGDNRRLR